MRTVQTVGLTALVLWVGCASGKSMPGEQVDASDQIDSSGEQFADARPDSTTVVPPDAPPPPPDACVPVAAERLVNPVFDLTPNGMGWVDARVPATNMLSGGPYPIITANGIAPHSAPNKAWFGGAAGNEVTPTKPTLVDTLHQDVAVPAGATNVVVSGFYLVGTTEPAGTTAFDTFNVDLVQTNGTVIENVLTLSNLSAVGTFTAFSKNITANVAGQTVRLRGTSINDNLYRTNFFVDSLSFKSTQCP
ncbi:MAG: hypothetical protein H0T65_14775 [Deltaproteobacteria bacterium]|nr:hypothetical protein [Deltaproteobacteria bacterium]